jgi:enterobactin synthetase component D
MTVRGWSVDWIDKIGLKSYLTPILDVIDLSLIQDCGLEAASFKRKREFLSGRVAGMRALKRMNIEVNAILRLEDGRPLWPAGSCGSLSHSDTYACAVVARTEDYLSLGVDLEPTTSMSQLLQIRSQFLTPEEERALAPEQALIAFSAKEALYKTIYPLAQTYFGFHAARVTELNENGVTLDLLKEVGEFPRGSRFQVLYKYQSGHVICLCFLRRYRDAPTTPARHEHKHESLRVYGGFMFHCNFRYLYWRPHGDSNPGYRRERAMS